MSNQIKTPQTVSESQWEEDQNLMRLTWEPIAECRYCKFPETECNCSNYDSEGNEL